MGPIVPYRNLESFSRQPCQPRPSQLLAWWPAQKSCPLSKILKYSLLFSSTVVEILLFNITCIALSEIDFSEVWIFITLFPQRLTSFLSIICWIANLLPMNLKYYINKMLKIHIKLRQVPNSFFFFFPFTYLTNVVLVLHFLIINGKREDRANPATFSLNDTRRITGLYSPFKMSQATPGIDRELDPRSEKAWKCLCPTLSTPFSGRLWG